LGPINAPAVAEMCALLEQPGHQLLPDAVWLGGQAAIFQHLRDNEALSLSNVVAAAVLCPDCMSFSVQPEQSPPGAQQPFHAYCVECGWVDLPKERARLWQANPTKVADWINIAMGLKARYPVTELVKGMLWHLGDQEHRRQRRSFFFGCQLTRDPASVGAGLDRQAAPGTDVVITTSDLVPLRTSILSARQFIPLRAIAHLRKGHLVLENLEAYFDGLLPVVATDETSLRLLHSKRVVLISGTEIRLSPQVYGFLQVLEQADGDEVHKRLISAALGIAENFRYADIKKHHRAVFDTFVQNDQKGNFWLKPEYLIQRG
jgi:hypothetical protein